jgi:fimbrial chaperone protein
MTGYFRTFGWGLPLGLLLAASPAGASQFTVNPTRVELSARVPSAVVSLRNDGQLPIRIQVKTHAWTQTLDGQMKLDATDDVVVFPALVTIAPGEVRRLRIAVTSAPAQVERTYRVFMEELPPVAGAAGETGVQVLTRVGIPVFLRALAPSARAGLSDVGLSQATLHFQIDNIGNTHFVPDRIHVQALSAGGTVVTDKTTDGWYILAGSSRRYEMQLDTSTCANIRALQIDVAVGETTLKQRLDTPGGACSH